MFRSLNQSLFIIFVILLVVGFGYGLPSAHVPPSPFLPENPLSEDNYLVHTRLYESNNSTSNGTGYDSHEKSSFVYPKLFTLPDSIFATLIVFFGAFLCAGAGVGGGAFNLAAYILILNLDAHHAVALSKTTIFGVSIGSLLVICRKRHPTVDRPLVDYPTALLMEPLTLIGTTLGVLFNIAFPAYIIIICLVVLLSITAYKTFQKGITAYKKEKAAAKAKQAPAAPPALSIPNGSSINVASANNTGDEAGFTQVPYRAVSPHSPDEAEEGGVEGLIPSRSGDDDEAGRSRVVGTLNADDDKEYFVGHSKMQEMEFGTADELAQMLEAERSVPWLQILALALAWLGFVLAIIFIGPKGQEVMHFSCGGVVYWVGLILAFFYLLAITYGQAYRMKTLYDRKVQIGYPFADGDIKWTAKNAFFFPLLCIVAGWAAGFLGVGGGLVKGPILLHMGLQPQVTTTTSSFMIFWTASSTTIQYSLLGMVPWDFGLWYASLAFCGAMLGQIALAEVIKRTNKHSYAAFLLGILEVVSMLAIGGLGLKQIIAHEVNMSFRWIC